MEQFEHYNILPLKKINELWREACKEGKLDLINYLETSPLVINKPQSIHFNKKANAWLVDLGGINKAITNGHMAVFQHIFNSEIYKEKAIDNSSVSFFIDQACTANQPEILKYILDNTPKTTFSHNLYWAIHDGKDEIFRTLTSSHYYQHDLIEEDYSTLKKLCVENKLHMMPYIFIELKTPVSKEFYSWLAGDNGDEHIYEYVLKCIETNELYNKIINDVTEDNKHPVKNKLKL